MAVTVPDLPPLLDGFYDARPTEGTLCALKGDASTRRYYRFSLADRSQLARPASLIVMQLPDDGPEGPSRVQARAFLDVQRFLAAQSMAVPQVYAEDLAHGLLLLEDLGDDTFEVRLHATVPEQWPALYGTAIDLLAQLHEACAPPRDAADCIAYRKHYDAALLRWELDHFREWGLEALHGPLSAADRVELDGHFDALTAAIVALPVGFVHRDYQSRNLIWAADRLTIIDFQDAFLGPEAYDLVALLCDSYVAVRPDLQTAMLARYAERRGFSAERCALLVQGFRLLSVQRKLKDAGRFVFIDRVRKNAAFLAYYPASLAYAAAALRELPQFTALRALLARLLPGYPG
jgi:aminoglycoside/choline kinase family phosphotransferase